MSKIADALAKPRVTISELTQACRDEWKEGDHPRNENGEFGSAEHGGYRSAEEYAGVLKRRAEAEAEQEKHAKKERARHEKIWAKQKAETGEATKREAPKQSALASIGPKHSLGGSHVRIHTGVSPRGKL